MTKKIIENRCPVCYEKIDVKTKVFISVNGLNYYKCKNCKNVYLYPCNDIFKKYDTNYNSGFFRIGDIRKASMMAFKIADFATVLHSKPRILEIGCGNGLTSYLLRSIGFDVVSTEMDKFWSNHLHDELGLDMVCSSVQDLNIDQKFDIVYSSHVIEHLDAPAVYLLKMQDLLVDDGIAIIDTPNGALIDSLKHEFKHFNTRNFKEHLNFICPDTLQKLAPLYNYKVHYMAIQNQFQSFLGVLCYHEKS